MSTVDQSTLTPGPMGWGVQTQTADEKIYAEKQGYDRLCMSDPGLILQRATRQEDPAMAQKLADLHQANGIDSGFWCSLIEEAVFGLRLNWVAQIIGSCFPAGTLIRMADGCHREIRELRLRDEVLTAEGNIGRVTCLMARQASEPMYGLTMWGHAEVKMTGEHPVLTRRGYVPAAEITTDDWVAIPQYAPATATVILTDAHIAVNQQMRRRMAKVGDEVGRHSTTAGYVNVYRKVPEVINLDERFGWLIGMYLAEGSTDGNKVIFSLNANERDTLAAKLESIWLDLFGIEASVVLTQRGGRRLPNGGREKVATGCKVTIHSVAWAAFFDSVCGKRSTGKRLHADIASGAIEFLRGVWSGWIDGDGYERGNNTLGTTVSKQLALDMTAIANALGYEAKLNRTVPLPSHGVMERQPRYNVTVTDRLKPAIGMTNSPTLFADGKNTIWRKVKSIRKEAFDGLVYNFEVAGDNSYVADGIGVHNCVASGGMRAATRRCLIESFLLGDPEEIFGTKLVGTNNVAPFGPYSYRAGRKYAGINGNGDGSYCSAHTKGAADYGWLPCSAPGLVSDTFPEPQSASLYRQWGANDTLLDKFSGAGRNFKLLETVLIKDQDTQKINLEQQKKPMMVCSMWAFRPKEPHPTWKLADGSPVWIYQRDTGTSWAHNMTKDGSVTVRGQEYRIIDNSWGPNAHKNGSWFAIPAEVDEKWLRDSEVQTIGEMDLKDNSLVA